MTPHLQEHPHRRVRSIYAFVYSQHSFFGRWEKAVLLEVRFFHYKLQKVPLYNNRTAILSFNDNHWFYCSCFCRDERYEQLAGSASRVPSTCPRCSLPEAPVGLSSGSCSSSGHIPKTAFLGEAIWVHSQSRKEHTWLVIFHTMDDASLVEPPSSLREPFARSTVGWGLKDVWVLNSTSRLTELSLLVHTEESAALGWIIELEWVKPFGLAPPGGSIAKPEAHSSRWLNLWLIIFCFDCPCNSHNAKHAQMIWNGKEELQEKRMFTSRQYYLQWDLSMGIKLWCRNCLGISWTPPDRFRSPSFDWLCFSSEKIRSHIFHVNFFSINPMLILHFQYYLSDKTKEL